MPRDRDALVTRSHRARHDPARAVVLVIDVQNDFCHPEGLAARQGKDVEGLSPAIDRVAEFLNRSRDLGARVVFVRTVHGPETDTLAWRARHPDPGREQSCREGSWGAGFFHVAPTDADHVVTKHRYSAFVRPDLDELLRGLGRDSLFVTGVATATCVESTLREGVCRDYYGTLVTDCCAAYSERAHARAVDAIGEGFGVVASSQQVLHEWVNADRMVS